MLEAVEASSADALTGLFNRRCFDKALDDQLIAGRPLLAWGLIVWTTKSINDTHGPRSVTTSLRAVAREKGGRLQAGGHPLPLRRRRAGHHHSRDDSVRALTMLRAVAQVLAVWRRTGPGGDLLCRAGTVATGVRRATFLARVDQALYRANDAGKNQVHHAG